MADKKTLTFVLMDPPYENARTTTALRLIDLAVGRGWNVNVFAYEGAVYVANAKQTPHENKVHGHDLVAEDHPTTKDWVSGIFKRAETTGAKIDWVQCGLCVDERGAGEWVPGPRRGTPGDLVAFSDASDNVLVIPTK
jgi:tRNA 2-thiouridine synthesizing protein D